MPEIQISDLDPRLQKQVENARFAIDRGNLDYAIEICSNVLAAEAGCLPVRKLLRAAQTKNFRKRNKMLAKTIGSLTSAPILAGAGSKVKKNPTKAMEMAEKALTRDPTNIGALKVLAQAAQSADLPETAVFAWEGIRDQKPDSIPNLMALGQVYVDAGRGEEAVAVGEQILKLNPGHAEAQELLKTASVTQSMSKGRWDEEGESYREKLKDAKEAVSLEQASKIVAGEDATQDLLNEALARVEAEPNNLNHYRDIVQGYEALGKFQEAIEWLDKARATSAGAADGSLAKHQADLRIKIITSKLSEKEKELAASPDDEALQQEVASLKKELVDARTTEAQTLVDRYPNEPSYRFELGKLFYEKGEYDKAIKEFQNSQRSPKVRLQSLNYMGHCFKEKKQYDLAVQQYEMAKGEVTAMNEQKKDITYQLAECFELMGNAERAIEEYKQIYAADISYRDVSTKIDEFYSKG